MAARTTILAGLLVLAACGVLSPVATPLPLPTCTAAEKQAALDALPPYVPSTTAQFIHLQAGHFAAGETVFTARGVNYYPSRYPWRRFLTEADSYTINTELSLLRAAGLNTLRLFLWNEALFTCPGSGAVPVPTAFLRLDAILQTAGQQGFRLIVTLNDLPDLTNYPLYTNPPHLVEQTRFIIERYRDEAAILAWDLRNEGDIDYGTHHAFPAKFSRQTVLDWLAETSALVRGLDANHLITAGWLFEADSTAPSVDFISFHHWEDAAKFQERLAAIRAKTDKPVLLEEFGYSTYRVTPDEQRRLIESVITTGEADGLLGWLIWAAFDFPLDATCTPPACPSQDNAEHHFGLWDTHYQPKPAADFLKTFRPG